MAIVRNRPFEDPTDLWRLIDEPKAIESAQFHLTAGNVHKEQ